MTRRHLVDIWTPAEAKAFQAGYDQGYGDCERHGGYFIVADRYSRAVSIALLLGLVALVGWLLKLVLV